MRLISKNGFDFICDGDFIFFIERAENHNIRFFKTDLDKLLEIGLDEYTNIKFGKSWGTTQSPYNECIKLGNGEYLTSSFYDSTIYRHSNDGNKIKEYNIGHFETGFDTTESIALDKNGNLWIAQPPSHYVGQFSLDTEKELFRIGGDFENPDTFDHPEQVRVFGDFVYVCDMGNKRICRINIDTKELTVYKKFEENTWEYGQFKTKEIAKLNSGIYEL